MFYLNGAPILANELEILKELKTQLAFNGIERFDKFINGTANIQFNCPIHSDGQESKPSCGILIVNRGKIQAGTVHCFSCGYTATLPEMISNVFGKDDMGRFGTDWLIKNFMVVQVESRKTIELDIGRGKNPLQGESPEITEDELESYRFYHPYMFKRKLTDEIIETFDIGYDKKTKCITFPVRDKAGTVLFIARRAVDKKYFHYPEGVQKPVYGILEVPEGADEIIICESIFNALTCYAYGKVGVALLGLGTDYQYQQLLELPARKFICGFDPDEAGQAAESRLRKKLEGKKLITSYILPENKDINDLSLEEFNSLKEVF